MSNENVLKSMGKLKATESDLEFSIVFIVCLSCDQEYGPWINNKQPAYGVSLETVKHSF